jgi:penicillin-binding protein 1C
MYRAWFILISAYSSLIVLLLILYYLCLPDPLYDDPCCTVIEDRNGEFLGARIADDEQWRFPASETITEKYAKAVIQYEDRYFLIHNGVNPAAILRAVVQNIRAGKIVQGGSTISMQIIRLSRKGKSRTIREKLIEMILASRLELKYNKREILSLYAANAPFGGNIVGLEAASWRYFNRPPGSLSWSETAVLAVLPNSPALIHPGRNRHLLEKKRNAVLDKLYKAKVIDSITCQLSKLEPLPDKPHPFPDLAPHLLNLAYKLDRGNRIKTTLLKDYQVKLNQVIYRQNQVLKENEVHNLAALILEVETGHILAYTGNVRNINQPEHCGEVDVISSVRSTGSILKPALYCMMLNYGELLPGTLIPDIPTFYSGYTPKNFTPGFDGAVPAKMALSRSLNVPAVRMLNSFGLERFHYLLTKLGISTMNKPSDYYGLSLILGGGEASLLEISGMFASFARILKHFNLNRGYSSEDIRLPTYISGENQLSDTTDFSRVNWTNENPVLNAASIWLTFESLIEVNRPESETGWKMFHSSEKIAWKTGTSFGFRDGWAIGTNPSFTVGVWAGNADGEGRPGLTGNSAAAPVLFEVFDFLPESAWFQPPFDEMSKVAVCRQSGHLAGLYCSETDSIWIPEAGKNSLPCPYHILIHLTQNGKYRMYSNCAKTDNMKHVNWFLLPPVQEWYYKRKNPGYKMLPPIHPDCLVGESVENMELIYPKHTATIYIPFELQGKKSKVVFEAAHRKPNTTIFWHLDDQYIGATSNIHQLGINPSKGSHILTLVDEYGNSLSKAFEVIDK